MNLLVLGNSEKLIRFIESTFPITEKYILGWRSLPLSLEEESIVAKTKWDVCLLAGYDYQSAGYSYDTYIARNVKNIMYFTKSCIPAGSIVVYANTMAASKRYTFSRYLYAKMLLADELQKAFPKTISLEFPTIIDSGKIAAKGGLLSKFAFFLLNHFGLLSTVVINESPEKNLRLLHEFERKPMVPSPIFLKVPRPLILDRLMRLMLG